MPTSSERSAAARSRATAFTPICSRDVEQAEYGTFRPKPIIVSDYEHRPGIVLFLPPLISPLVFENSASDARDHCGNERNFLSFLRLSLYLVIISVSVTLSIHFKAEPTPTEKRMALPLGLIFWALSFVTLVTGTFNYFGTVEKYRKQKAVVQSGIWTNLVLGIVAATIIATCVVLLKSGAKLKSNDEMSSRLILWTTM